ncbi:MULTISPECIES: phosphonate C-P lyase system protein PhnG [unclassified Beijerinckia]|uniref:phosphonate C-P lyase system protein PhnG n=1 Tax=unclassified Beijerinckia TaxID=2638183 RepID=UPI00089D094C|nr:MULTISPECIES: phosphonate C-P lyase system protein PhnG [unclassified Beijerinckia]MDH7797128.1 alpha-D-ribose 1-methylphosphonate 5-triphosphate synthase subunit PhnG [Beijerinckia sp. GAS462]SEC73358.1 alpha-D-ribose 1-methylphosphonate 5-triphosphate synthase subunit PhnG [Beijerinckia sp. 28-YEA-48]
MSLDTIPMTRRDRMAVLARSNGGRLRDLWSSLGLNPGYKPLRGPESGLVMLRGQIGASGEAFNVGEATVTRASVKLDDGSVGHAMALGRDTEKARLAAIIDALCQDAGTAARIDAELIIPIKGELDDVDEKRRQETAATRVDFFTMVRGEDQ